MESPAGIWLRSGRKPQYLFKGSRDEMIQEMKAWVERRKLKNQAYANSREEFLQNSKSLMALPQQPGSIEQNQTRLFEIMERYTQGVNRSRELANERDIEALHGQFLVATVTHGGIAPADMTSLKLERVDADIFSILALLDEAFDGRKELEALAEREATAKWQAETAARDANHAEEITQGLVPLKKPRVTGAMPAQAHQEMPKDPALSMAQAMAIASEIHLGEGLMQMAMGRATPATIARMLEMIRGAETSSPSTTTAATNSTPTSDRNPTTAATTSTPNMDQDQPAKPTKSKAKKKNDARKARKKALAKEAAAARNADGAIVDAEGNDDQALKSAFNL